MPTDIFITPQWDDDETCLIVGSGPALSDALHVRLEENYDIIIALNKAALIVRGDYWLCAAPGLLNEEWFTYRMGEWLAETEEQRAFYPAPIFIEGVLTYAYPDVPYTFQEGGDVNIGDPCQFGVLKHGASVAGRAIQLAYLKGIKDIVLAGVDQRSTLYFDSTENVSKRSINPDGIWTTVPNINKIINYVQGHGCRVRSLTPTALDVEVLR